MKSSLIAWPMCVLLSLGSVAPAHAAQEMDRVSLPSFGAPAGSGELSPADERRIGEESMLQIRDSRYYLDDPDALEYLNRLGYRLVAQAPASPYSFLFFPLKVGQINAFAMPGGFIAVFTGTVLAAQDESELAGVMAHEISHVTQRHIARMFENQKGTAAMALGSFLLAILAGAAGGSSGGDAASAIMMGGQAALISNQLKFSRSAEQEADRLGFQILVSAGYDPMGMPRFFRRLQDRTGRYESSSYLFDHPLTIERISDMENRARRFAGAFRRTDNFDFRLMQARLLVLQSDRQAGWEEAEKQLRVNLSHVSGLDAAVAHYGLSVAASRMGRPDLALKEARKAVDAAAGRDNLFLKKNLAQAQFDAAPAAQKPAALEALRRLAEQNPVSSMMAEAYIGALNALGRHEGVLRYLRSQSAFSSDSETYCRYYARASEALGKRSESFLATGKMYAARGQWKLAAIQFHQAEQASDADFYTMSEIDARLREAEARVKEEDAMP